MDNLVDLFKKIKMTSGTNDKVELLQSYPEPERLKTFLTYAYDPNIIYGITSTGIEINSRGLNPDMPLELFKKIPLQQGRNAKISLIKQELASHTQDVVNLFLNALDKDLGVNINTKVINKAYKGLISEFGVQLAHKETKEKFIKTFSNISHVYLNLKIDGIRCIIHVNSEDEILFFSRDGKMLQEFLVKNIREDIKQNISSYIGHKLDGEIYSSKFEKLMTVVNRKHSDTESIMMRDSCKYAMFDVVMEDTPLEDRLVFLTMLPITQFIHKVKYIRIEPDYGKIKEIAKAYIAKGHEGIIIKNPFALYQMKRTNDMLKFKNKETEDLEIIGYEPGEKGTKYEHVLGALIVNYNGNQVHVGSGFTDKEREELWRIKEQLPGMTAEVSFMERTHLNSLRHPVYEMLRTDK